LKAYDKAFTSLGNVLPFEATILKVSGLKAYRPKEGDPEGQLMWRPIQRGIADLRRLTAVSQRATERYMNALAQVGESSTFRICRRNSISADSGMANGFAAFSLSARTMPFSRRSTGENSYCRRPEPRPAEAALRASHSQ
jgi:hypothetical protein